MTLIYDDAMNEYELVAHYKSNNRHEFDFVRNAKSGDFFYMWKGLVVSVDDLTHSVVGKDAHIRGFADFSRDKIISGDITPYDNSTFANRILARVTAPNIDNDEDIWRKVNYWTKRFERMCIEELQQLPLSPEETEQTKSLLYMFVCWQKANPSPTSLDVMCLMLARAMMSPYKDRAVKAVWGRLQHNMPYLIAIYPHIEQHMLAVVSQGVNP